MKNPLTGSEVTVKNGYFQIGRHGNKRGLHAGYTVDEVLTSALQERGQRGEPLFVAVFVRDEKGIICRYSARVESGERVASWSLSG